MDQTDNLFNFDKFDLQLNSSLRKVRSNALDELIAAYTDTDKPLKVGKQILYRLIECLKDEAESCREKSAKILRLYLEKEKDHLENEISIRILLTNKSRLVDNAVGETSEEIRCLLVELLRVLIANADINDDTFSHTYAQEVLLILDKCVIDPCPELRRISCEVIVSYGNKFSSSLALRQLSNQIVRSVVPSIQHKHYRVRIAAINCLKYVIPFCEDYDSLQLVFARFGETFPDTNPKVRIAVLNAVTFWLLTLSSRSRHASRLLTLILSSLDDENEECRQEAFNLWQKIGGQYMKDRKNDERIERRAEYLTKNESVSQFWKQITNVPFPNYGCCFFVRDEMSKFLPPLMTELTDWKVQVKINSSKLLKMTVLHAQSDLIPLLEVILPTIVKTCINEQEVIVRENIIKSAEIMGYFVPVGVYWKLLGSYMENECLLNHLVILSSLLKYTEKENISYEIINDIITNLAQNELDRVSKDISDVDEDNNIKLNPRFYVLEVLSKLINFCENLSIQDDITYNFYTILLRTMTREKEDAENAKALDILNILLHSLSADINELETISDLNKYYFPRLFDVFLPNCSLWMAHSPDFLLFLTLIKRFADDIFVSVPESFENISQTILEPTAQFQNNEAKFLLLLSIAESIENRRIDLIRHKKVVEKFLTETVMKSLIWRSGRVTEIIRSTALTIFKLYFEHRTDDISIRIIQQFIPLLVSLCEDNYLQTRISALHCLSYFSKSLAIHENYLQNTTLDLFIKMLNAVTACLNDENDNVRLTALSTLQEILLNIHHPRTEPYPEFDQNLSKIFELLFLLAEDENLQVRTTLADLLCESAITQQIRKVLPVERIEHFLNNYVDKNLTMSLQKHFIS